jgi:hypothetical protein
VRQRASEITVLSRPPLKEHQPMRHTTKHLRNRIRLQKIKKKLAGEAKQAKKLKKAEQKAAGK